MILKFTESGNMVNMCKMHFTHAIAKDGGYEVTFWSSPGLIRMQLSKNDFKQLQDFLEKTVSVKSDSPGKEN